jgi:hypothetical protein
MPRCSGFKADNSPCERIVGESQEYCFSHNPDHADERKRNASKAGRSKSNRELRDVRRQLQEITDQTLSGKLDTKRATAATQALQAKIRAVEVERRLEELYEVEQALQELESRVPPQRRSVG